MTRFCSEYIVFDLKSAEWDISIVKLWEGKFNIVRCIESLWIFGLPIDPRDCLDSQENHGIADLLEARESKTGKKVIEDFGV